MEHLLSFHPVLAQGARSQLGSESFSGVDGIDVLEQFPGFTRLMSDVVIPDISEHPRSNFTFVVCGETGVGKSTIAAMLTKYLNEEEGVNIQTRSLSFAQSFGAAKRIGVFTGGAFRRWLVDPTRKHGEYLPQEYQDNIRLMTKNLMESRRNLKHAAIVVEQIGIVPDWLGTGYDYGLGLMKHLAKYEHTYFLGIVPDPDVEARSMSFRTSLERMRDRGVFDPVRFNSLVKKYRIVVDEPINEDNFANFMMNVAGRVGIERVQGLVNEGVFDLMANKGVELIKGFIPEDTEDLAAKFKNHPQSRTEALESYLNYLFSTVMGLGPNRYLVGQNRFIADKEINLYRKLMRESALPLNPKLLNGRVYEYEYSR